MAGITIDATTEGLEKILKKFENLENMNFRKPLADTQKILLDEIDENFKKQGAIYQGGGFIRPGGAFQNLGAATTRSSAWAPLAKSTRRQRKRLGYGPARPILERTGDLRKGFHTKLLTDKELVISNDVEYASYHQDGGKYLPQRKIIGWSRKSYTALKIIFSKYVADIIRESIKT